MIRIPLLIFAVIISHYSPAAHSQVPNEKLDRYFREKAVKAHIIGLQVASIGHGQVAWHGSYGIKELHNSEEINDSTLFMMASCSKPVTALGIMKLYDQGKLDLDDDINDHLPFHITNPYYPENAITLRMLLTHTSSLRDNWEVLDSLYTLPEGGDSPIGLQDFIEEYFLENGKLYSKSNNFADEEPGSGFRYCNMGYSLLGVVMEQVSGSSFSAYMQKEIFQALQMNNSYWFLKEIPHSNIAHAHKILPKEEPEVLNHYGYPSFPDGQLRTTATDYAQVIKLMINRGMVNGSSFMSEQTIDEFLKIQYPEVAKYQAISWNYNEFDAFIYKLIMPRYLFKRKIPAHSGYDPGVETYVTFDPKKGTGAIIFINSPIIMWKGARIYHKMIMKLFSIGKRSD